jgi:hypothetical protein
MKVKNIFSVNEEQPSVDPSFATQAQAQAGGSPRAPSTPAILPPHSLVPLPDPLEQIARIAAPTSPFERRNS